jgi:hypothetical protein
MLRNKLCRWTQCLQPKRMTSLRQMSICQITWYLASRETPNFGEIWGNNSWKQNPGDSWWHEWSWITRIDAWTEDGADRSISDSSEYLNWPFITSQLVLWHIAWLYRCIRNCMSSIMIYVYVDRVVQLKKDFCHLKAEKSHCMRECIFIIRVNPASLSKEICLII